VDHSGEGGSGKSNGGGVKRGWGEMGGRAKSLRGREIKGIRGGWQGEWGP